MKAREPKFAGSWYSNNPEHLSDEIDSYLIDVECLFLNTKAIIVPHAGYMFSGRTAAHAFKQINKDTDKVIILGTAHRYPLNGSCVMDYDYYDSPLGKVKVSADVKLITDEKDVTRIKEADADEHSIEIEIPFLQKVLTDYEILPIIVGRTNAVEFAALLEKYSTDNSVIVASVDLSHFHSYDEALKLDSFTINSILELNSLNIKEAEIDSPYAIEALIELARRNNWKTKLLDYKNSGDIISDRESVVGYSAIVFYEDEQEQYFTDTEKEAMINIARNTTEMYVKTGKIYKGEYHSKKLDKNLACFVTIKEGDELKGCIGTIEPVNTLYNSIIENAISAATRDPRFKPITEDELRNLNYEVSVLSVPELFEPESIDALLRNIKGKGVIISKDMRRAVYLPQVWENFKSESSFLSSLCQKAGFVTEEWKNYKSMKFYVFTLLN